MIIHGTYHGQVPCIIPLRSAISDNAVVLLHTSDVEQPAPVQLTFLPSERLLTSEKRYLCLGWEQTNNKILLTFP